MQKKNRSILFFKNTLSLTQVYRYRCGIIISFLFLLFMIPVKNVHSKQKEIKIALAQIFCLDGDRSGNFARIENAVIEAKEKGAEIVCFPETAILGWVNPDAHERACPIPGKDSDRLCELAKKYDIFICIGLAEKDGDKLYDAAILIDNRGVIRLKHRKINTIKKLMTPPYSQGKGVKVIDTKFGKVGLLICADSFKEEILAEMRKLQPELLLIPYGWANDEDAWPGHAEALKNTVRHAAEQIGCTICGTDLVGKISNGPWKGLIYGGASVVSDKSGRILGRGNDRDRDIVVLTITL